MAERIKFAGDPEIRETGAGDGKGPQIPLSGGVAPIKEERLDAKSADMKDVRRKAASPSFEDDDNEDEVEAPAYSRENIGPRIGDTPGDTSEITAVEEQLDNDDLVPLIFSKPLKLQDKGIMHSWEAGLHMVPISLAGSSKKDMHWYLRHNGVRRGGGVTPNPGKTATEE